MRYYTKDFYEEMQVYSSIAFPSSKEEWDELVASDLEYITNQRLRMDWLEEPLLRSLPESLHSRVLDRTLLSEYPSEDVMSILKRWRSDYEDISKRNFKESRENYESIKNRLPKGVIQLHERSLHDARFISFDHSEEKQECRLLLEHHEKEKYIEVTLKFKGVKYLDWDWDIGKDALWLYDEIYIEEDDVFALNVLFDNPLTEICIIAEGLLIQKLILD